MNMNSIVDKKKVIELAVEWEEIWKGRPFENSNGLGCQGAFALYYFLKEMDPAPELVVECGTWRGFSTWVIQMAVPDAKIICSDPILASRQFLKSEVFTPEYRVKHAEYTWQDFSNIEINIPEEKRDRAVVFFDDHQNKIPRLEQAIKKGFKHIIYGDNVPYKYTHTSFEYLFEVERDESVKKYFSRYTVFPPVYSGRHKNGILLNGLLDDKKTSFPSFYAGRDIYSWVTKVNVSDFCFKSSEEINSKIKVDGISGGGGHELAAFLESALVKRRPANHTLPRDLIVSLTSYKPRFENLHLTLKSLLLQQAAPNRLILWIAENERHDLPQSVWELQDSGLDICFCEDLFSYKKIVPTLLEYPESFIVTADDDIYYEPNWLKGLIDGWDGDYKTVVAHRAHKIKLNKEASPLPYSQWSWQVGPDEPVDGLIFPTGCGGVLYPPHVFHKDVVDQKKFMELCPTADDIWLYWMASLNGAKAKRSSYNFRLAEWSYDNVSPLWHKNIQGGGNDKCISMMLNAYGNCWFDSCLDDVFGFCFMGEDVLFLLPNKNDHIQKIIKSSSCFYEKEMLLDIRERVGEIDVALDIGSNIGNHSVFFAKFMSVKKVYAFEPHPYTFKTLQKNVELNNLQEKIVLYNAGVADSSGMGEVSYYSEQNTGMSKVRKEPNGAIELLRIDDIFENDNSRVGLIKIDVEGMEINVLKGARNTLERFKPVLYIEAAKEDEFEVIKNFLSRLGYKAVKVFNATPTYLFECMS